MDLLRAIQLFSEIAKTESFSSAAQRLGISVAAASRQIKELEDWCGLQLLNRTTRRVSLTHEGARYLYQMQDIANQVAQLEQSFRANTQTPSGRLRITAPVFISYHFLTPILPAFLERYPQVEVELDVFDRRVDLINEGYDLAIRVGILDDSQLQARKLTGFGLKLVASTEYFTKHHRPQNTEELVNHQCLVDTVPRFADRWPLTGYNGRTLDRVPSRIRINNGDIIRELAVAGSGIALLPDWMVADAINRGDLEEVLPGSTNFDAGIYAVYPQRRHSSINIRTFIDFLIESKNAGVVDWIR